METTAIVGTVAAVFAAATTYLVSTKGSPLWIAAACGALIAAGICWAGWRQVRSYLCILRYRKRIRENGYLNSVTLLGAVSRALPGLTLADVYVDVSLRDDETEAGGQKVYGLMPGRPGRRATLDDFLLGRSGSQFAVYGMPGSGKSTLLRSAAIRMSRKLDPRAPMPILVVLARHLGQIIENPEIDLAEIAVHARWLNPDELPVQEVKRWLAKGRCMIMLDGLDEVPEQHRPAVMLWAEQQHGSYPECNLVVTSRELGFESASFEAADLVLEVCPLTRDQIDDFVQNCYRAFRRGGELDGRTAAAEEAELFAGLQADPALYDLASTPLLLQLMVYVHRNSDDGLPASRGELYERMVGMLLYERRNRVKLTAPVNRLELKPKLRVVQRLALQMMLEEAVQFDPLPLVKELVEEFEIELTAKELLRDLCDNGLLSILDSDTYMFAHLSFQEYLAAKEIHEQDRVGLLAARIHHRWWRNTALFWVTAYDSAPLIEACIDSGTADGWGFAIELQHEVERSGGEVDRRLADRIEAFLAEEHPVDSPEYLVVCDEVIGRNLGEVNVLAGETFCDAPVNEEVYRLFSRADQAKGFRSSAHHFGASGALKGLWPNEVSALLDWLDRFDHGSVRYRLPVALPNSAPVIRNRTAEGWIAVWVQSTKGVQPKELQLKSNRSFEVPAPQLKEYVWEDWRYMLSRFDFQGRSEETKQIAAQIRQASTALQKAASQYKSQVGRVARPEDSQSVMARTLRSHREFADSLAKTADELVWYAEPESDSINLLALLRLASWAKPTLNRNAQNSIPAVPVKTIGDHLDAIMAAARSAVQASYRLHHERFREEGDAPDFLRTAGSLLLSSRLPAQGAPTAFKLPKKLDLMVHAAEPILPHELPGLLDQVTQRYGRDAKPSRVRPRRQVDDMLTEMRQPLVDMVTRRRAVDPEMLASMRLALYATALWMEVEGPDPLWSCVMGLVAIEARHCGEIEMDEVIVLVREELG